MQSVKCLATDVSLTADPGVKSSIPAQCNGQFFPQSVFSPRGKNGPGHSFPAQKNDRSVFSPGKDLTSQFFPHPISFFPPPHVTFSEKA